MNRAAIDFAEDAAREYGLSAEAFTRSGKTNAAATEKGLRHNAAYSRHLDALCEPYEMLDAVAMKALTGTDYYVGGLFTPGAAMIQPALLRARPRARNGVGPGDDLGALAGRRP